MPILLQKKLRWGRGDGLEGCGEGLAPLLPSCRVGLEIRGGPHLCGWRDQRDACLSKLHKQSRGRLQSRRWGRHPGMAGTSRVQAWEPFWAGSPCLGTGHPVWDLLPRLPFPSQARAVVWTPTSLCVTHYLLPAPLPCSPQLGHSLQWTASTPGSSPSSL